MPEIDLAQLLAASSPGGPSCLTSRTELAPAAGAHASVAPARFTPSLRAGRADAGGVYGYERRFLDGVDRQAVVIDSKQSQLNRVESALQQGIDDGHPTLSRLPHVVLTYQRDGVEDRYTDLTLPHRVYDGHLRAGTVDGVPTTQTDRYRALRDVTPVNARLLLQTSPVTLVFGGWDASRRARQGRWRSALVGEVIGFCADDRTARRGGARVDPVAMQVRLGGAPMTALAEAQRAELTDKTYKKVTEVAKKAKPDKPPSASELGLGGIPPSLDQLAGVACDRILRSHVLSFAALRQMRFGGPPEVDAACRALLAALALDGLARADSELYLRANCDLIEAGRTEVTLDQRGGDVRVVDALSVEAADALLADALGHAERTAGIVWQGAVLHVAGNQDVIAGAVDGEDAEVSS